MRKILLCTILFVFMVSSAVHADWIFNPFTGKLDYYLPVNVGAFTPGPNNSILVTGSTGTVGWATSFTRIVDNDLKPISIPKPTTTTEIPFEMRDAMESMGFGCAITGGTSVAGVDLQKCGGTNWASCATMLSGTITPNGTSYTLATMSSTTVSAGEKVKILLGTVTGTVPAIVCKITGTSTGVK